MRQRLTYFLAFLFTIPSVAQDHTRWYFNVDLVPRMKSSGTNIHYGDIVNFNQIVSGLNPQVTTYGTEYEPLVNRTPPNFVLSGEVIYKNTENWGLGLSGWQFKTTGTQEGTVTSPPQIKGSETVKTIRLWDHSLIPVPNELESSNLSPISFWSKNENSAWNAELFVTRTIPTTSLQTIRLETTAGFRTAGLNFNRTEGRVLRTFIYNYFGASHVDNKIKLESISSASYKRLYGPSMGFRSRVKLVKRLGLDCQVQQAFMFGKLNERGNWLDEDRIFSVKGPENGPFTTVGEVAHLIGNFHTTSNARVVIPVTDLKVRVVYATPSHVELGVGGLVSVWSNVKMAPQWSMPGEWTAWGGTGWIDQRNTLIFNGIFFSISFNH